MSKPFQHAKNSARMYGGKWEDYKDLHNLMDETKSGHAAMRHRCIFHSSYGIYLVEKIFGMTLTTSDKIQVATRDIAEQHVLEDLGKIPSLDEWLNEMNEKPWMMGIKKYPIKLVD